MSAIFFLAMAHTANAGTNTWTSLGPPTPDVAALVVDPVTPSTLYLSTTGDFSYGGGGEVFKSTDAGATWRSSSVGLPSNTWVGTLAIDPRTPSTLYVATGRGVLKSTDAAATWKVANTGLPTTGVGPLVIDPLTPSTLYTAVAGSTVNLGGVVFKSADAGATWQAANAGLPSDTSFSLVIDPATPSTLYAGTNHGVFKSTDAGATWQAAGVGLPSDLPSSTLLLLIIDPVTPRTLYAGTYYGVFKSTDAGVTWEAANAEPGNIWIAALAIDPLTPRTLYVGGGGSCFGDPMAYGCGDEVLKSTDAGATWAIANAPPPSGAATVQGLAIDPITPRILYATTYEGVLKSTDAGVTWRGANAGLPSNLSIIGLAIAPVAPRTLYAGERDGYVFKSNDAGATWEIRGVPSFRGVLDGLAVDPVTPSTLYAFSASGYPPVPTISKSTDAGVTWNAADGDRPADWNWVDALAIDPVTPSTLYAGLYNLGVFKSTDAAGSWEPANAGLPLHSWVRALAIDPATPSTLYAGTAGDGVFKSTDAGASWEAAIAGLSDTAVEALAIDPVTPSTLYAGTTGSGVFKSTDAGATWEVANAGLQTRRFCELGPEACSSDADCPEGVRCSLSATALAIDPVTPRTLYAVVYGDVFRSTDAGTTWEAAGLANTYVLAFDSLTPSTLYAGTTHGVFSIQEVPPTSVHAADGDGCGIATSQRPDATGYTLALLAALAIIAGRHRRCGKKGGGASTPSLY